MLGAKCFQGGMQPVAVEAKVHVGDIVDGPGHFAQPRITKEENLLGGSILISLHGHCSIFERREISILSP
jgi:hypothetical protein